MSCRVPEFRCAPAPPRRRRPLAGLATGLAAAGLIAGGLVAVGPAAGAATSPVGHAGGHRPAVRHDPFLGHGLWVNPRAYRGSDGQSPHVNGSTQSGRARRALRLLAATPTAVWVTTSSPQQAAAEIRADRRAASSAGRLATFVLFNLPDEECLPGRGAAGPAAYRAWVAAAARALRGPGAAVVLEPDGLAQLGCLSPSGRASRLALLRFAVRHLAAAHVPVYIDAGNSGWLPAARMAGLLRSADVAAATGFALNVSNYHTTPTQAAYGAAISRRIGGKHFVIDTSRNGDGPGRGRLAWCNLPSAAIGHLPTAHTGRLLVDAYLWIKVPGRSDGACRPGAPPAGVFWPAYAVGLVVRAEAHHRL